ncbi:MAG: helicase-related protein [bacterium]
MPKDLLTSCTWEDLASEISQYQSVLCVVNRRDDCRILYKLMPGKGESTFHLSALMCGEHRTRIINQIKQRLKDKILTRVISTQLVEAGVDLDFPVVYRALAGLDSIAQAAGRCNRDETLI